MNDNWGQPGESRSISNPSIAATINDQSRFHHSVINDTTINFYHS